MVNPVRCLATPALERRPSPDARGKAAETLAAESAPA